LKIICKLVIYIIGDLCEILKSLKSEIMFRIDDFGVKIQIKKSCPWLTTSLIII